MTLSNAERQRLWRERHKEEKRARRPGLDPATPAVYDRVEVEGMRERLQAALGAADGRSLWTTYHTAKMQQIGYDPHNAPGHAGTGWTTRAAIRASSGAGAYLVLALAAWFQRHVVIPIQH
jgi:hypothetical protein